MRRWKPFLPRVTPMKLWKVPLCYSGRKRARYELGLKDLLSTGLTRKNSFVAAFVKAENVGNKKLDPDPRIIQFRTPPYCVALAQYLKPMEHQLYNMRGFGDYLPNTRVIGKGLSARERANLLHQKMQQFNSPVVISLDAKRFDQHVSKELLEIEHSIYLTCYYDEDFAGLLGAQIKNICRAKTHSDRIRYKTLGKRMSGDMNTALGNCLLMVLMVSTFMNGKKYDILDDGDDCLLIVEEEQLPWVLENVGPTFLSFGHEIKIENVARTMEEVEWCQCRPVQVAPGEWNFIRKPEKIMSCATSGSKYTGSIKSRQKLINSIGMAELVLNHGVPVIQEYAWALIRNANTDKMINLDATDSMYYRLHREMRFLKMKTLTKLQPRPITMQARLSYYKAFGVGITEQIEQEKFLRSWRFNFGPDTTMRYNREMDWAGRFRYPDLYR